MIPSDSKAIRALMEAVIIPAGCRRFELIAEAGKPVMLRYEVFATEEQVCQIAEVWERNPEEARQLARSILFRDPKDVTS